MEFNRAQLKQNVKLSMKAASSRPMLVTLVFSIVVSAGTWLINTVLGRLLTGGFGSISDSLMYNLEQGRDIKEAVYIVMLELFRRGPGAMFSVIVGGTVLSILVMLWRSSMNVGYEGWCLSMVRGEDPPMNKIFDALPRFAPVLLTRFLTELFVLLWSMLLMMGYFAVLAAAIFIDIPALSIILVLLAMIAAVLGIIWVTMRYALVDYVLLDKGLTGMDAIRESKRLMQGRVKDAFVLKLSFFGWYLLESVIVYMGILAAVGLVVSAAYGSMDGLVAASMLALVVMAGVAIGATVLSLWLRPYTTGSMAKFYDWAQGRTSGFTGPRWGGGDHGWGEPHDYTWTTGPSSGTGAGNGPTFGNGNGSDNGRPRSPKPPRDDPWN